MRRQRDRAAIFPSEAPWSISAAATGNSTNHGRRPRRTPDAIVAIPGRPKAEVARPVGNSATFVGMALGMSAGMTNRISSSLVMYAAAFAAFLLAMNVSRTARAQVAVEEATPPRRTVSITISPIHLALPVVELTGEFRVLDKLGLKQIVVNK